MNGRRLLLVLLAAAMAAVVAAVAVAPSRAGDRRLDRAAADGYDDALRPIVDEWGRIEVQGMRPAVADLRAGDGVPAEAIAGEAAAWAAAFRAIDERLSSLVVPRALASAHADLRSALRDYAVASQRFEAAAYAEGSERERAIDGGVAMAARGADRFDLALARVDRARADAGLLPRGTPVEP